MTCDDGRNVQNWWPVWSPDGTRVAFQSNVAGSWRIYVIEVFLFDNITDPAIALDDDDIDNLKKYRLTNTNDVTEVET